MVYHSTASDPAKKKKGNGKVLERKKNVTPSSHTFRALGWNYGMGDCGHLTAARMGGIQGRNLGGP
jgi:hypothetical protein